MTFVDLSDELPPTAVRIDDVPLLRERTRRRVAYLLLLYLGVVIAAALIALFAEGIDLQRAKDLVGLVLGSATGLVGTVVGFYFGAQTAREASR